MAENKEIVMRWKIGQGKKVWSICMVEDMVTDFSGRIGRETKGLLMANDGRGPAIGIIVSEKNGKSELLLINPFGD
jgi:hypothetical protein